MFPLICYCQRNSLKGKKERHTRCNEMDINAEQTFYCGLLVATRLTGMLRVLTVVVPFCLPIEVAGRRTSVCGWT